MSEYFKSLSCASVTGLIEIWLLDCGGGMLF